MTLQNQNHEILRNIVEYLRKSRKENTESISFLDKGAIMRTDKSNSGYYIKFDTLYWILAGKETGKFTGAGFALNTKYYNIIHDKKLDILYFNRPNYVYYYRNSNYERNSFYHIQKYNSERVRVISIESADDVWKV